MPRVRHHRPDIPPRESFPVRREDAPALYCISPNNWCPPRGLNRAKAAAYVGVGASLFDEMVRDGRMPKPLRFNARTVWHRFQLDEAFEALRDESGEHDDLPEPEL
jgi:predicted DNA-binding transcriptional regulator AlpA